MSREIYTSGDLVLDVGAAELLRDGQRLELPQLSFELLLVLVRRAPDVVSPDELVATVWQGLAVSSETLTQRVALLRRALADDAQNPRYVRVVRGRGYQWVPEVRREPMAPTAQEIPAKPRALRRVPWLLVALLGGILVFSWLVADRDVLSVAPAAVPKTQPAQVGELIARAGTYLARHQERDNERAVELFGRALVLERDHPDALAGLSLALSQRSTKFNQSLDPQAEVLARRALELAPNSGRAHHALGLALDSQGRLGPALTHYLAAAQFEDVPAPALSSAAYLLQVSGRLAEALEMNLRAAAAAAAMGTEPPIYLEAQLGTTLGLLGFAEAAEVWFERGLELKPDNVFGAMAFARWRGDQGRGREAETLAAAALARGIRRPELYRVRAEMALRQGDRAAARIFFAEALALDPDDLPSRVRSACLDGASKSWAPLRANLAAEAGEADAWPDLAYDLMVLETCADQPQAALAALDRAVALGYRNADALLVDPFLAGLRTRPLFPDRIERLRIAVATERQRVLGASWLPSDFLAAKAANK